ncbi:MAG TPA: SusC/RagA family TonB-linked outer membrane protein, partial [Puia sp.]|nr:SusC/RagA family TonB-linked outer membrane protein [Puia sp.]
LSKALSVIEKKSGFRIFFSDEDLPTGFVDVRVKDEPLSEVLDHMLSPNGLRYKVLRNKAMVLVPKDRPDVIIHVSGKVIDNKGVPLSGISVRVRDTQLGTVTDGEGNFDLRIPEDVSPVLVFSSVGFEKKEMVVSNGQQLKVVLEQEAAGLNEVVIVGYGKQKKMLVTSAISSVDGGDISKAPVASISNTLGGRVSGVLSRQSSGQPGSDNDQIQIRGIGTTGNSNPLVIVNGIPMNYNQLNPAEVESVTILKDAAAVAPYGVAGANGVILVTTKRGKEGKFALNYDGYYGFQQPTYMPHYLDAYGYASQYNIASKNSGGTQAYTDAQLQSYKNGTDPDHFPNTDWVHQVINFHAPITRHTLSFTGGSQKIRFYSSLGYFYQQGVVSVIDYKRYNLSANIDANVTNTTTVSLDIEGNLAVNKKSPGEAPQGIFTDVTEIPPILPLKFQNGMAAHALLPQIYQSGYDKTNNNFIDVRLTGEQKIPFLPGLALKGVFAYQNSYDFEKVWTLPVTFYSLSAQNTYVAQKAGPPAPTLGEVFDQGQILTAQGYLTYKRTFGKHDIDLLGVYEIRKGTIDTLTAGRIGYGVNLDQLSVGSSNTANFTNTGTGGSSAQIGWVYRADYAYAGKYLLELSGRYDGHYYFAPGKRYAFFPAASAGWRLSEEHFIKDNFYWIDQLKIRGSYGKSGNLAGAPFQYLTSYGLNNSYILGGTSPYQTQGIAENSQANPNITWETAKKTDIGLDAILWKGKLGFTIDYFHERRSDMLVKPNAVVPAEYGIGISQVNEGIMENQGVDLSLTTVQRLGKGFRLNVAVNFSYAQNKLLQIFENSSTYNNPNRRLTGKPYNTQFGLKSQGLYQQSDFNPDGTLKTGEPVPTFGPVAPGDIKYADLAGAPGANGKPTPPDGKIDANDNTAIGKPLYPEIIYGASVGLAWHGLELNTLWQGAADATIYLTGEYAYPFYNGAKIFTEQTDAWTPTHTNARYPRLLTNPTTNNTQQSSFWMYSGSYLRLKTAELAYSLPPVIMKPVKLRSIRLFVAAQNLLTISGLKFIDPET